MDILKLNGGHFQILLLWPICFAVCKEPAASWPASVQVSGSDCGLADVNASACDKAVISEAKQLKVRLVSV